MNVPQFLFSFKTPEDLSFRAYEINLLRTYVKSFESTTISLTDVLKPYSALFWDPDFDSYLLAKLALTYGFTSYLCISCDKLWALLHPKILAFIDLPAPDLKSALKTLRHLPQSEIDQVFDKSSLSMI